MPFPNAVCRNDEDALMILLVVGARDGATLPAPKETLMNDVPKRETRRSGRLHLPGDQLVQEQLNAARRDQGVLPRTGRKSEGDYPAHADALYPGVVLTAGCPVI